MGLVYSDTCAFIWKELQETYDKVNGFVMYNLLQKINIVKQGGSSVSDYYHMLNSMWREFDALTKLSKCTCEVKCNCDASKELTLHQQLMKLMQFIMRLGECYQPVRSALLTKDSIHDVKDAYNNVCREESYRGVLSLLMKKLLSLINDNRSDNFHANMAGANQQLTVSTVGMFSVVDVSSLNITISHPNGTLDTISHIVNLKLTNNIVLYDVRMVHIVLGYPADQVLATMHNDLKISKSAFVPICEVCYKAKQARELFPLFDHKSKKLGELVHLDFIAVKMSWPLYQFDVNNAFLYRDLVEDVYMTLPQGFDNDSDSKVCKLNKSLYGLKQAPRQWNAKLTTALVEHGFVQSNGEFCIRDFKKILSAKF
uniref:Ribonuclease H-like domain-containing protein n=1 Tax=Tanacetum cinerariifolium TaxID=118510 RepID=A0A699GMT9_TANCI|nr:ribonuclease H-like domain-containing protein [Tanacetum cinerariifolium]